MPDEEEDRLGAGVEEVLYVETLMRWDGDPCACLECDCLRFRDGSDEVRCPECVAGRHANGGLEGGGGAR